MNSILWYWINNQINFREANAKLQDNNDGLREIVDINSIRSPRHSFIKRNDLPFSGADDDETPENAADILNRPMRKKRHPARYIMSLDKPLLSNFLFLSRHKSLFLINLEQDTQTEVAPHQHMIQTLFVLENQHGQK